MVCGARSVMQRRPCLSYECEPSGASEGWDGEAEPLACATQPLRSTIPYDFGHVNILCTMAATRADAFRVTEPTGSGAVPTCYLQSGTVNPLHSVATQATIMAHGHTASYNLCMTPQLRISLLHCFLRLPVRQQNFKFLAITKTSIIYLTTEITSA